MNRSRSYAVDSNCRGFLHKDRAEPFGGTAHISLNSSLQGICLAGFDNRPGDLWSECYRHFTCPGRHVAKHVPSAEGGDHRKSTASTCSPGEGSCRVSD